MTSPTCEGPGCYRTATERHETEDGTAFDLCSECPQPEEDEMTATEIEPTEGEWSTVEAEPVDLDPDRVNRTLKALAYKQRDLDQYDAAAAGERGEMRARHDEERTELEDRITRGRSPLVESVGVLTRKLELVGSARIADDPGAGTWSLPAGRISVGGGGIVKVWPDDESALLAWAEKNAPDAVVHPPAKVDKNKLWEAVKDSAVKEEHNRLVPITESGEIRTPKGVVPGLTVAAKHRTITAVPNTDAR